MEICEETFRIWTSTKAEPVEMPCCLRKIAGLTYSSAFAHWLHLFDLTLQVLPHSCFFAILSLQFFDCLPILLNLLLCLLDEITFLFLMFSSLCLLVLQTLRTLFQILFLCALVALPALFFLHSPILRCTSATSAAFTCDGVAVSGSNTICSPLRSFFSCNQHLSVVFFLNLHLHWLSSCLFLICFSLQHLLQLLDFHPSS